MMHDAAEQRGRNLDVAVQGTSTDIESEKAIQSNAIPTPQTAVVTEAVSTGKSSLHSQTLKGLALILVVILFWLGTLYVWLLSHGVRLERFLTPDATFLQSVAEFNFLGISDENPQPSILSLNLEIVMWSIFAVAIRTVYRINVAIRHKRFDFTEYLVRWEGDMMMAAGLAEVVILFLRITRFSLGNASLTLAEANYETIAALAFILGFYNEDARRLLGGFRARIVDTVSSASTGFSPSTENEQPGDE
jgi:hypothetical protein